MCTIAILLGIADAPLVVAANRDELYARKARPPEQLAPGIVGGVDELSGGTWLAITRGGRFAAVTNQRALAVAPPGLRSRGLAVKELAAAGDPDAYVASLDPRAYASMNLVWGDADRVSIAYLRNETGAREIETLARGVHVLCNDRLGAPGFPRGVRLARAIEDALARGRDLTQALEVALGDHTHVEPEHHALQHDLERELTATCIHTERYGTRSSTIAAFDRGGVRAYLHADGPPCVTPFRDLRGLL